MCLSIEHFKCLQLHCIPGFWNSLGCRQKVLCVLFKFKDEQRIRCRNIRFIDNTRINTYVLYKCLYLRDDMLYIVKWYLCVLHLCCTSKMYAHEPTDCMGLPISHCLDIIEYCICLLPTMMVPGPHCSYISWVSTEVHSLTGHWLLLSFLWCLFVHLSQVVGFL